RGTQRGSDVDLRLPARHLPHPPRQHRQRVPLTHHRAADPAFREPAAGRPGRRADRGERRHLGPRGRAHGDPRRDGAGRLRRGRLRLRRTRTARRARHPRRPGADRDPRPPRPGYLHGPLGGAAHLHAERVHPPGQCHRPGDPAPARRGPGHARPRPGPRRRRAARLAAGAHGGGGRGPRPLRRTADVLPLHRRRDTRGPGPGGDGTDGGSGTGLTAHRTAAPAPPAHRGRAAVPVPVRPVRVPQPRGCGGPGLHWCYVSVDVRESTMTVSPSLEADVLRLQDPELADILRGESERQRTTLQLIAAEHFTSPAGLAALGSPLASKYAEGYPKARHHGGCSYADAAERLAVERAKALFGAEHANVQAHSGSSAVLAAYAALLRPGDTVLALGLPHGGHLTHGSPANFSGRWFRFVGYGVDAESGLIDHDQVRALALAHRPKAIVCGSIAYPRHIDYGFFREVADEVGAH